MDEHKDTLQPRNPLGIYFVVAFLVFQCTVSLNLLLRFSFSSADISSGQYVSLFVFWLFTPIWAIVGLLKTKFYGWWFTVLLFTYLLLDTILWFFWGNNIRDSFFTIRGSLKPILTSAFIFLPILYRIVVAVLILKYLLRLEIRHRFSVKNSMAFLTIIAFSTVLVLASRLLGLGLGSYVKGIG